MKPVFGFWCTVFHTLHEALIKLAQNSNLNSRNFEGFSYTEAPTRLAQNLKPTAEMESMYKTSSIYIIGHL